MQMQWFPLETDLRVTWPDEQLTLELWVPCGADGLLALRNTQQFRGHFWSLVGRHIRILVPTVEAKILRRHEAFSWGIKAPSLTL